MLAKLLLLFGRILCFQATLGNSKTASCCLYWSRRLGKQRFATKLFELITRSWCRRLPWLFLGKCLSRDCGPDPRLHSELVLASCYGHFLGIQLTVQSCKARTWDREAGGATWLLQNYRLASQLRFVRKFLQQPAMPALFRRCLTRPPVEQIRVPKTNLV